jgi:hypothetical protein
MNELSSTNSMTALASIERRINYHIQGAYANIVEVGRCLIEAKATGVVPHGQFEEWAERVTGLKKRNYQRLMQVAREVSPDSAMAKLPITKITAILSLPEAQREEVAEKAVEENQSLRELQATIEAMKSSLDEARQTEARLTRERDTALAINERIYRERAEATKERDTLKQDLEQAKKRPGTGISAEAQAKIDGLQKALDEEQSMNRADIDHLGGLLRQSEKKVDTLELEKVELAEKLADAERMAEYQAQQREKAQQELLDLRTQAARGDGPAQEDLTAEAVGMAARTFIGTVGYVPHSDKLVTMREGDRQQIATYAAMLQHWAEEVLKAVSSARDTVIIEGV